MPKDEHLKTGSRVLKMKFDKVLIIPLLLVIIGVGLVGHWGYQQFIESHKIISESDKKLASVEKDDIESNKSFIESYRNSQENKPSSNPENQSDLEGSERSSDNESNEHRNDNATEGDENDNATKDDENDNIGFIESLKRTFGFGTYSEEQEVVHPKDKQPSHHDDSDSDGRNAKRNENKIKRYDEPLITYDSNNVRAIDHIPKGASADTRLMVGRMYIPSVNINIAVLEGVSNRNLDVASGTMKPNQKLGQGNYAIAGHYSWRDDLLFTPLKFLEGGESIYLTDKSKVYEYKVEKIFTVDDSEGHLINDSEGDKILTLVTCTDINGTARRIVRGELINTYPLSNSPSQVKKVLG